MTRKCWRICPRPRARRAADEVPDRDRGRLDGAVLAAGWVRCPVRDTARLILQVNFFGVVDLLEAWRAGFGQRRESGCGREAIPTTMPAVPNRLVRGLLDGDAEKAVGALRWYGKAAVTGLWRVEDRGIALGTPARRPKGGAGRGIGLNAIALPARS